MMDAIKKGMTPNEAYEKNIGTYGRFKAEDGAVKWIDPRKAVSRRCAQMALFEEFRRTHGPSFSPCLRSTASRISKKSRPLTMPSGVDAYKIVEGIQPICFENAKWAYELGAAIALQGGREDRR